MDCCNTIALTPVCAPRDLSIHASLVFFSLSGGFNRPETTASVKSFSTLPRGLVHSKMLSYKVPPGRLGVDQLLTVSYRLCGTLLYHCSKETSSKLRILLEAQVLQYPHHSWQKQHRDANFNLMKSSLRNIQLFFKYDLILLLLMIHWQYYNRSQCACNSSSQLYI